MARKQNRSDVAQLAFAFDAPAPKPAAAPGEFGLIGEVELSPLDTHFAELMLRLNGAAEPVLENAASHVSAWRAAGHACLPLGALGENVAEIERTLLACKVVGRPGEWKPLILDAAGRLYLQRYHEYEQRLARMIVERAVHDVEAPDSPALQARLQKHLPVEGPDDPAGDQRRGAELALRSRLAVITGGPGTGKTRTVGVVLQLLREQSPALRVALAAPTGKAAARLTEAIAQFSQDPDAPLAPPAVTLHRLLGLTADNPRPRFHRENPLAADVIIIDEASMVDLATMVKLFDAAAPTARLILLGDKDQLASVEAGRVLAEVCGPDGAAGPLTRKIVELRHNFRFQSGGGITRLSRAVNQGDAELACCLLAGTSDPAIQGTQHAAPTVRDADFQTRVLDGFAPLLQAKSPAEALRALGQFRILCALRRGPYGVQKLNRVVEEILTDAGRISAPGSGHYAGRPLLVTRNDYDLGLFNGDTGVVLTNPEAGGELRAYFPTADGQIRSFALSRLPEHETVWAMTVHKSQGSEFQRVLFLLPDRDSPVLTRELVYTGLTRAREAVELWYTEQILRKAIARPTLRGSGLHDALWR